MSGSRNEREKQNKERDERQARRAERKQKDEEKKAQQKPTEGETKHVRFNTKKNQERKFGQKSPPTHIKPFHRIDDVTDLDMTPKSLWSTPSEVTKRKEKPLNIVTTLAAFEINDVEDLKKIPDDVDTLYLNIDVDDDVLKKLQKSLPEKVDTLFLSKLEKERKWKEITSLNSKFGEKGEDDSNSRKFKIEVSDYHAWGKWAHKNKEEQNKQSGKDNQQTQRRRTNI